MKSLISEMSKYFHELNESTCNECSNLVEDCVCEEHSKCTKCTKLIAECMCESDLDEQNVTGAIAGYNTPNAFTSEEQFKQKKFKYESKKPKALQYNLVHDLMDAKYETIIESYRKFTTDGAKTTPEDKVKRTIKDVAIKLKEIEQLVNYSSRLKTESGIAREGYGTSVNGSLTKIAERLTKIAERVRSLGE